MPEAVRQTPRTRPTAARATALLRRYHATGDLAARNELVMLYAPMVRHIVFKKIRELPPHCDADDYVTVGMEALIKSADRYDTERGTTFEQFAWTRVHGAIVDEMRRSDWAPRSVRRFARDADRASVRLAARDGRTPTDTDVAETLGVSVEELRTRRHEARGASPVSLNAPVREDAPTVADRVDQIASGDSRSDPVRMAELADAKQRFRAAFAALPDRERSVAVKLYLGNMTLREVGEELGLTESRVCQINSQLRSKLRRTLSAHAELFDQTA